jgi:hypothetical protein
MYSAIKIAPHEPLCDRETPFYFVRLYALIQPMLLPKLIRRKAGKPFEHAG